MFVYAPIVSPRCLTNRWYLQIKWVKYSSVLLSPWQVIMTFLMTLVKKLTSDSSSFQKKLQRDQKTVISLLFMPPHGLQIWHSTQKVDFRRDLQGPPPFPPLATCFSEQELRDYMDAVKLTPSIWQCFDSMPPSTPTPLTPHLSDVHCQLHAYF
jgi:hypothetical protein